MTAIYPDAYLRNDRREATLLSLAFVFLALTAAALVVAPSARLRDWTGAGARWAPLLVLPVWTACAWLTRRFLHRHKPERDPFLLPVAFLLAGWGNLVVWRLAPAFGARQTGWFIVGTVALIEIVRGPSDLRWLRRYRYLWLSAGILLTALTMLFGTNPSGGDPRLWLGCCGFYLQPSEPLRLLLIAYVATYLSDRLSIGSRAPRADLASTFMPLLLVWGLSIALLAVQRDLGTGMLFLALLAVLLYLVSGRMAVLVAAAVFAGIGAALGYRFVDVVHLRILAWLNPWLDPFGDSYQIVQSLIAIASGGLFGRGPGLGSPGFVPVAHTDFIYAAVAEEWGLLGGIALIGLFAALVSRGLRIAARGRTAFAVLLSAGLSAAFGVQSFLIIGGVVRLVPLTGVTLPFVSYGGSSLVTSFIALALLLQVSGEDGQVPGFERPLRGVQAGLTLGWIALAIVMGWWTLYRAPALVARTDNPRRALSERYSRRGALLDADGRVLADSVGRRGSFERRYPEQGAAPVVGYDSVRYGQSGLELAMDPILRGEAGYEPWVIHLNELLTGSPPPGLDVRLTVDLRLQEAAMQALQGRVGAIVLLDARQGDLLALASSPSYAPDRLDSEWQELTQREDAPLLNRVTQGSYQPGTALFPFLLAWAQAGGVVRSQDDAEGMFEPIEIGADTLTCLSAPTPLERRTYSLALQRGCPRPFVELAQRLGSESFLEMLDDFGFGRSVAVRLPASPAHLGELAEGAPDLARWAVGQGDLTVSPLQMARALASLGNDGVMPAVGLVQAQRLPDGSWEDLPRLEDPSRAFAPSVTEDLFQGLVRPGGRVGLLGSALSGGSGGNLAWYLGLGERDGETVAVVVVLEGGLPGEAERAGVLVLNAAAGASQAALSGPALIGNP